MNTNYKYAKIINSLNFEEIEEDFLLEKCPDKTAKLSLKMKFEFISEVNEKEMLKCFIFSNFNNKYF